MTDYLLDTNALLLLTLESGATRRSARDTLAAGRRFVSFVSAIEISIKHSIGKLSLPSPFEIGFSHGFQLFAADLGAAILPLELEHVAAMARLPLRHHDPFDRLIIAQALIEDMTIATRDRAFAAYEGLSVLEI